MNTNEFVHVVVRDTDDNIVLEFDTNTNNIGFEKNKDTASAINPEHYRKEKVQCIDAMRFFLSDEIVAHGCLFNIFKYLWRYADKNGAEDIEKAKWYMQELKRIINANDRKILDAVPNNMDMVLGGLDDNNSAEKNPKTTDYYDYYDY